MAALVTLGVAGTVLLTFVAVVKVFIPMGRWSLGVGRRFMGAIDNIAGRDERVDRATGEKIPAIPAIHERFAGIESRLDGIENTEARFDRIESRVDVIEAAQAAILAGTYERGATANLAAVQKIQGDVIDVETD